MVGPTHTHPHTWLAVHGYFTTFPHISSNQQQSELMVELLPTNLLETPRRCCLFSSQVKPGTNHEKHLQKDYLKAEGHRNTTSRIVTVVAYHGRRCWKQKKNYQRHSKTEYNFESYMHSRIHAFPYPIWQTDFVDLLVAWGRSKGSLMDCLACRNHQGTWRGGQYQPFLHQPRCIEVDQVVLSFACQKYTMVMISQTQLGSYKMVRYVCSLHLELTNL